ILHYIGSPDHHTRRHLMDTFPLKSHRRGRYDKKSMSVIFIKKWKFHPANAFLARKGQTVTPGDLIQQGYILIRPVFYRKGSISASLVLHKPHILVQFSHIIVI